MNTLLDCCQNFCLNQIFWKILFDVITRQNSTLVFGHGFLIRSGLNFINIYKRKRCFGSCYLFTCTLCRKTTFVRKTHANNVDENDTSIPK